MQTFPETRVVVTGIFGDQCVNWNHHLAESSGRGSLPTSKWQSNYTVQDHWGRTARCPSLNFTGKPRESTSLSWLTSIVDSKILSWCTSKQTIYVNKHMNLMSPNMITVNPWNRLSERNTLNRFEPLIRVTKRVVHIQCSPETVPCCRPSQTEPNELKPNKVQYKWQFKCIYRTCFSNYHKSNKTDILIIYNTI